MANKIHAIKFLNWLFLRIKPSDYDPTQPLEFEGGIGGGTSLPDQTGNAGKFLQTNGTDIVWSDVLKISNDILIGSNTLGTGAGLGNAGVAIGHYAHAVGINSIGIGTVAEGSANKGIAIGYYARVEASGAIQLGSTGHTSSTKRALNKDKDTFKVANGNGNFEMMDADGNVPLERLAYVTKNISELGDQVQGIEERIPGHITTDNPVAAISDAGKHLKSPTDTDASFCLQFGDLVMCGGTVAFNNLGAGIAAEMPADLPVAMAGDYIVVCTPTADSNFDHLIADYGSRTSNTFTISCDNMGDAQATNVKVSWIAIGKKGA